MTQNLAEAVAAVQLRLPQVVRSETAKVPTKSGPGYSYNYATLADVNQSVLPLLAEHGLAFLCLPTLRDDGTFALEYRLLHVSGEAVEGAYPLPLQGGPQAQGSAITYARRYVLMSLIGVAPEDDDGQAAQVASQKRDPRNIIFDALKAASVDPQRFVEWLEETYTVSRFSDLEAADQVAVLEVVEDGTLIARLKE